MKTIAELLFVWLKKNFSRYTLLGASGGHASSHYLKSLRIVNIIHLFIAVSLFTAGVIFYGLGISIMLYLNATWAFINIMCLWLNSKKKFQISKNIFLLSILAYVLVVAFILNLRETAINILLVCSTAIVFLFSYREYLKIFSFYVITIAVYFTIKHSNTSLDAGIFLNEAQKSYIDFSVFFIGSAGLIAVIFSLKILSHTNEYHSLLEIKNRKKAEKALAEAKRAAERANYVKTEFLTVISHNIRTPINAILGLINLLLMEAPKKSQLPKLSLIKSTTDNLVHLIDNVLDFNSIETGTIDLNMSEFSLKETIDSLLYNFATKAQEKNTRLQFQLDSNIPNEIIGDRSKLLQIISNLLSNAIKFTENGMVTLTVKQKQLANAVVQLYFEVSDTGMGIAKEKQKYLFEIPSAIQKSGYMGSGLGLPITWRLVQVMGGELMVESHMGKGSKFYFSLNFKIPAPEKPTPAAIEHLPKVLNGIKILLTDDNPLNILVAETYLNRWQAVVYTAENAITALELAKEIAFDVLIIDLQLPHEGAFEVIKELKLMRPSVKIIALTTQNFGIATHNFRLLGINDVMIKPFHPNDLYVKIQEILTSAKADV